MKWDSLINLFTLYKSSIEHNIDLLVILFYPFSSFLLHATADDMPAKTEKAKVLHYLEACFQVLTTTNGPVAKLIDGNVQLYVLSPIPDNFQGVAEMVLDIKCQLCYRTQISSLGENNVNHRKYF